MRAVNSLFNFLCTMGSALGYFRSFMQLPGDSAVKPSREIILLYLNSIPLLLASKSSHSRLMASSSIEEMLAKMQTIYIYTVESNKTAANGMTNRAAPVALFPYV